ncbi:MAG: dihydropteroate synthase [Saprospiraceae bacterium]|nr:dihydropteroate synthase [Saprospiraceae bacterium]
MSPLVLSGNGLTLDLSVPKVMGVINVNGDSFYKNSRVTDHLSLLQQAEKMISEGADILDIGAMSSRPGAVLSNPDEETKIISESVSALRKRFPDIFISIDTVWSSVAHAGIQEGANMINDISAFSIDSALAQTVAAYDVPYVLMHMRGVPENMQHYLDYSDVILELICFFEEKMTLLQNLGLRQIVLDPGIGFGKNIETNFKIIKEFSAFSIFDKPLLAGISRKSFISKTLNTTPDHALNGSSVLHGLLLSNGADILRVHDVKEAIEAVKLVELLKKG